MCCGVANVVKAAGHLQTADDDDSRLTTALLTAVVALERQFPAAFGRTLDQRWVDLCRIILLSRRLHVMANER